MRSFGQPVQQARPTVSGGVRRRGLDPLTDSAAVSRLVSEVIADYDELSLSGGVPLLSDPGAAASGRSPRTSTGCSWCCAGRGGAVRCRRPGWTRCWRVLVIARAWNARPATSCGIPV